VTLRSNDPRKQPSIVFNHLEERADIVEFIEAFRTTREFFAQPAWEDIGSKALDPGPEDRCRHREIYPVRACKKTPLELALILLRSFETFQLVRNILPLFFWNYHAADHKVLASRQVRLARCPTFIDKA